MPSRTYVAALAALALAGSACLARGVSEDVAIAEPAPPPIAVDPPAPGGPMPDEPARDEPNGDTGNEDGAQQMERNPDIENPSPVPWERVSWDKSSQSLTVHWTSGVEPCTQLFDVTVEIGEDVVVTVLEGAPPEAATISCIAMAQAKQFTVELDEDVSGKRFVDGAA